MKYLLIIAEPNSISRTNKVFKNLIGLIFLLLSLQLATPILAQNKRVELEIKRQKLLKQIETTTQSLNQTHQNTNATRDRLEALQNQIENREALINNLHEEIDETDVIIARTEDVLTSLNEDIQRLRVEYATMARRAYKMKVPNSAVLFMLSSNNMGDAYKKWQYFRMYDKFRKRQARLIVETKKSLVAKNDFLVQQKAQKETLALTNEQQKKIWSSEKENKAQLLSKLKEEEGRLSGELKSQEKQSSKLNSSIERLIMDELEAKRKLAEERARKTREEANRLAREKAKERKSKSKSSSEKEIVVNEKPRNETIITESAEDLALASDFRSNKGKLPPPSTGSVVRSFGKQQVLDKVTAVNNGIDIKTAAGADVRAVFTGTVSIISSIPGLGYVVLIQHGTYYTVYSNLSSVSVKKGQTISTRQTIGHAGINPVSNDSEVHFEVWQERTHLNPSLWIAH